MLCFSGKQLMHTVTRHTFQSVFINKKDAVTLPFNSHTHTHIYLYSAFYDIYIISKQLYRKCVCHYNLEIYQR